MEHRLQNEYWDEMENIMEAQMNLKEVVPCGKLYSQGREYFLLRPYPIERDSWQESGVTRWLVVPDRMLQDETYPHARHIVSNAFLVDYTELPAIRIRTLENYDVLGE